jgi:phosphate starvation-inducible PhoH-like protein
MSQTRVSIPLSGVDLLSFLGPRDQHLRRLEDAFDGRLVIRGDALHLIGEEPAVRQMEAGLERMLDWVRRGRPLDTGVIERLLGERDVSAERMRAVDLGSSADGSIHPRTAGQARYIEAVREHEVVLAIGPAGTGKTYLAVVMAVRALLKREVDRIFLVRPAVEAGEQLGFLPGDLQEKVDPYLRPLYDALTDMLGASRVARFLANGTIEVAPLAYMRGRTLNRAFVILDEGQNTTLTQMKMFLTRIGEGTRAIVTGDITQIDLQDPAASGLVRVRPVLADVPGVAFVELEDRDVVRHPLVRRIVEAFDQRPPRRRSAETRGGGN